MRIKIDKNTIAEHSLEIICRDFTTQTHCSFCTHALTSGKALMLRHPAYGEVPAGPKCGKELGDPGPAGIPDFTRVGTIEEEADENSSAASAHAPSTGKRRTTNPKWLRVIEYLELRITKLPPLGFDTYNPALAEIHGHYKNGNLTEAMADRVNGLIKEWDTKDDPKYAYGRLALAYTHAFWIERCLQHVGKKLRASDAGHLLGFKDWLAKKRYLTPKQIAWLNSDLVRAFGDNAPKLDPQGFEPYRPAGSRSAPRPPENKK